MVEGRVQLERETTLAENSAPPKLRSAIVDWLGRRERLIFIGPPVALVIGLAIFPLLSSLGLSLVYWDFANPDAGVRWAGLSHWARLFEDEHFHYVARTTILYMVVAVPLQYVLGLVLALVLNEELRARRFFRAFFLLPMMLSPVAIAFIVGRMMFNEAMGPINDLLRHLSLSPVMWLTSGPLAVLTIILVDTWQWTPFMMLLLLAGLQSLPVEVMEAARLDGRSAWHVFWRITFPLLMPWTVTTLLLRSLEMLKIVDVVTVLTNGGPGIATESLTLYAYRVGLVNFDLGYASAIAYTLLIFAIVSSLAFLAVLRRWVARASYQ